MPPPNVPAGAPPCTVYDAMVMLQWAALPEGGRQHATLTAVSVGQLHLAMSQRLLDEVRGIFFRPELQKRLPSLTPRHAADILRKIVELSELLPNVPARFSLPQHPKDDHLFDLAIQAEADYLVTWESRLLKLQSAETPDAQAPPATRAQADHPQSQATDRCLEAPATTTAMSQGYPPPALPPLAAVLRIARFRRKGTPPWRSRFSSAIRWRQKVWNISRALVLLSTTRSASRRLNWPPSWDRTMR